jgi:hypothetical protein
LKGQEAEKKQSAFIHTFYAFQVISKENGSKEA